MAVAQLSKVVLMCPRADLGTLLSKLSQGEFFHPSEQSGLIQDTQLVILSSQAHAVYSEANSLLRGRGPEQGVRSVFESGSMTQLVSELSKRTKEISASLSGPGATPEIRAGAFAELSAIREAALAAFKDISRIRVRPGSKRFLVTEGFVPTGRVPEFKESLGSYFLYSEPISRRQPGIPYVPSLIANPRVVKLFEGITFSVGIPKYNEVDPTPVVAFVFPLFFGVMFSDVGRGLILFFLGVAFRDSKKEDYKYLGRLLLVLGVSAVFVGALRGLFFGIQLPYPAPLPSPSFLVQGPSFQSVVFWLEVGIVIGTFHLAAGYVLAVINRLLSRDYAEALLGYLPTLTLYGATIPFVFAFVGAGFSWSVFSSATPTPFFSTILGLQVPVSAVAQITFPIIVASLLVLLFARAAVRLYTTRLARPALRSLLTGAVETVVRPAELLVHTVSYVRLGILLVVGSVLGELLGSLFKQGAVGIILAVPGNLAVVGIEAFIVYIQDLRLNVYEWFSKFYSGAGRPFSPLVSHGKTFSITWAFQ